MANWPQREKKKQRPFPSALYPQRHGQLPQKRAERSIPSVQLYHCTKESHDWNLCTQVCFDLTLLVKSRNFSIFYFHIFHCVALLCTAQEGKNHLTQDIQFCHYHKNSLWIVLPYGNSYGNVMKKDAFLTGSGTPPKTNIWNQMHFLTQLTTKPTWLYIHTGYIHSPLLDYQVTFDGFRRDMWHIPFGNTWNPNGCLFKFWFTNGRCLVYRGGVLPTDKGTFLNSAARKKM